MQSLALWTVWDEKGSKKYCCRASIFKEDHRYLVIYNKKWVVNKTGSLLGVTLSHSITIIILYVIIPLYI